MRRIAIAFAVLLCSAICSPGAGAAREGEAQAPQAATPQQPPVFRGGTTLVQIDAIVGDASGQPIVDLAAEDFEVLDDGRPVPIQRVRFLGAEAYNGDATLAPIRTHDDEEREASRDDVHVYAIFLDDYHVRRMGELRVVEPLLAFVRQLPATDLVAVYYPLDSMTDVHFSRERQPVFEAIREFKGRLGDYQPVRPVEEEHLRHPREIEQIRRQITTSALEGLATHLGGIKQGRKTIVLVSEGFVQPVSELRDLYQAANRANVAVYPIDPRGMTGYDRGTTAAQMMNFAVGDRDMLRALALETGGRAIVYRNDIRGEIQQIVRDASAYYLIAYESPHPDDGKFHRVTVRVRRPRATVFARTGYWSLKRGQSTDAPASLTPAVAPAVQEAVNRLADSLRPNADEPAEAPRRIRMPEPPAPPPVMLLLSPPTVSLARGRTIGDPVARREFRRTDTIVVRSATTGEPATTARLLDRHGQPLTDVPVTQAAGACEVTLALGNLGPGDYVMELSAQRSADAAQQYVAFRVMR
jgi:VWFA-related protein